MSTTSKTPVQRLRYERNAYQFVFDALQHTQRRLDRKGGADVDEEAAHITGPELLDGIRSLAIDRFGLLTTTVFRRWGVRSTDDFGRIVFELVERGEMRKTDRDRLSDFFDVYDFEEVFDRGYDIDTSRAFQD